jgi:large subunit ribosomal protein L7/L12
MDHGMMTVGGLLIFGVIVVALMRSRSDSSALRKPPPHLPEELNSKVRHLIAENKQIEAIKLVREQTNVGLKEAKDIVDGLKERRM